LALSPSEKGVAVQIVLLGPPGAGKGTQAKLMVEEYHLMHLSTGELLRQNIAEGTALGMKAAPFMERGQYVPDALVNDMVAACLERPEARGGFILDGYPRTVEQAETLDALLESAGHPLDVAIHLDVNPDDLVQRLSGRRVCTGCGATYHLQSMPPLKPDQCDLCGSWLYQRPDDSEETIRTRMDVYRRQTEPVLDYYLAQRKLRTVDAGQGIERTFEQIQRLLGRP
jgi:adenylate kinase